MSDYIKCDDAINALATSQGFGGINADELNKKLNDIPSADVVERKRICMYLADLQLSTDPHTKSGRAQHKILELAINGIADMRGEK